MEVLVIGAGGQLGRDLCDTLGPRALSLTHAAIELSDPASVRRALTERSPRVVINAAAYNRVDDAELRPHDAFSVNAIGARELACVCRDLDCVLVQFSSDYVFGLDRKRGTPYDEQAAPGPLGVYGLSKLGGEYFVRSICPKHFVIRTCGLYGLHGSGGKGTNFVETMLRLARERGRVRVVNDQRCTPTNTMDLAHATLELVETSAYGLYHWTNGESCTWFEFANEIFRQSGIEVDCRPITSAEFGARAARPHYSVLATDKAVQLGLASPRVWQEALGDYLARRRLTMGGGLPSQS